MAELPGARGGSGRRHGTVPGQSPTYSLLVLGNLPGWWDGSPRDWPRRGGCQASSRVSWTASVSCRSPRMVKASEKSGRLWVVTACSNVDTLAGRPIGRHDHI